MNLKFAAISLVMGSLGSVLAMDSMHLCYSPFLQEYVQRNAKFKAYNATQTEALENFVNEATQEWKTAATEAGLTLPDYRGRMPLMPLRVLSRRMPDSSDSYTYNSDISDFVRNPASVGNYKKCLRSQLKMGVLDLRSLEYVLPSRGAEQVYIPTPKKVTEELLPPLKAILGLTVYTQD
jgi:hypothetical protein